MVKTAHAPMPKPKVCPNDVQSGPWSEHGSGHDEVYLALGRLRSFLLVVGLFPVSETVKPSPTTSVVSGLRVSWASWLRIFSLVTFLGILVYFYNLIWQYVVLIPNQSEAILRGITVVISATFAMVNLMAMTARAPLWPLYFQTFQAIDAALDISFDEEFRSYVRRASRITIWLFAFLLGSVVFMAINKIVYGDFSGSGFPVGMFCYAIFINGSQILPEILFTCICRALGIRIKLLAEHIHDAVQGGPSDGQVSPMRNQLEKYRNVYLRLMDVFAQTNRIFGGPLFTAGVMNPVMLTFAAYLMVRESLENPGLNGLKITVFIAGLLRVSSVCLSAQSVMQEIMNLKRVLILIPSYSLQLEKDSLLEIELFMRCIKYSRPKFTAFGFLTLDKAFLGQVSGTVLTYALALLELNQQELMHAKLHQGMGPCTEF